MSSLIRQYETFWGTGAPASNPGDFNPVTLGNRFIFTVDCFLIGIRFFRDLSDGAEHIGIARENTLGTMLQVAKFPLKAASGSGPDGWQSAYWRRRIAITAGDIIDLNVWHGAGNYYRLTDELAGGDIPNASGRILAQSDDITHPNGRYSYGADLNPTNTFASSFYGIDPIIWRTGT